MTNGEIFGDPPGIPKLPIDDSDASFYFHSREIDDGVVLLPVLQLRKLWISGIREKLGVLFDDGILMLPDELPSPPTRI